MGSIADLHHAMGSHTDALAKFEEVHEIRERTLPAGDSNRVWCAERIAELRVLAGSSSTRDIVRHGAGSR